MAVPMNKTAAGTPKPMSRIWHTPTAKTAVAWFIFAVCYTALFYTLYLILLHNKARLFTGPFFDIIFRCGVMSYIMILGVAAYSLRTRFFHGMPWKAQSWVWAHMWVGIASIMLALLHGDFRFILHFNCSGLECVSDQYWAMPSLYGLIFLVFGGIIGKGIDRWQARVIAEDAQTNGVGIVKAIVPYLVELEYRVERFCAGKSDAFKQYCAQALKTPAILASAPALSPAEQADFQRAHEVLSEHARLSVSLAKQRRARFLFKTWRFIHMILVPLILIIISYHAIAEFILIIHGQIHVPKP
jgi:hypothetical protein